MSEAQTLREKVNQYFTYSPDNDYYLNFWYLDKLGMVYGYDVVHEEVKRQEKERFDKE